LVTDSHSILAMGRNHFYQLFNVHGVSDVRQKEIHTAEPIVPEPSVFEVEMASTWSLALNISGSKLISPSESTWS
jgi:hypothetical protein